MRKAGHTSLWNSSSVQYNNADVAINETELYHLLHQFTHTIIVKTGCCCKVKCVNQLTRQLD